MSNAANVSEFARHCTAHSKTNSDSEMIQNKIHGYTKSS